MVTCWLGNYDKQVNKIDMHSLNQNRSLFADPGLSLIYLFEHFFCFSSLVFLFGLNM